MSLHTASKYLASKGRKGDTELVHMTKDEVRGLQQLALAHGGSLTINPETGLVEAGWLKSILPMVAGAALTVATGGTALAAYAPLLAAGLSGAGMYAATGSLKDGLLAGLGAFGGGSLASGIMEAGAETLGEQALEKTAETGAQTTAPTLTSGTLPNVPAGTSFSGGAEFGASGVPPTGDSFVASQLSGTASPAVGATGVTKEALMQQAGEELAQLQGGTGVTQNIPLAQQGPEGLARAQAIMKEAYASPGGTSYGYQAGQNMQNAWKGLPDVGKVIMNAPMKTLGAAAAPILMNASMSNSGVSGFPPSTGTGTSGGVLGSSFQGYTPTQPNPYYEAQYPDYRKRGIGALASGGIVAMDDGGTAGLAATDQMRPMSNTMYPQAQQEHTQFATSTQYPVSMRAAMDADYDTRTDPETGQELPLGMASGGVTGYAPGGTLPSSPSIPNVGIYRDTDADTAGKDAYQAALIRLQKANKMAGLKAIPMPKARMESLGNVSAEDMASGGVAHYNLGGYSDGGRMLKGPGNGTSDSIPASIGAKQPARLADGEFVIPARIVSELGNGSSDAGARELYKMMDRVQQARRKTTGKNKVAVDAKARTKLPA